MLPFLLEQQCNKDVIKIKNYPKPLKVLTYYSVRIDMDFATSI